MIVIRRKATEPGGAAGCPASLIRRVHEDVEADRKATLAFVERFTQTELEPWRRLREAAIAAGQEFRREIERMRSLALLALPSPSNEVH